MKKELPLIILCFVFALKQLIAQTYQANTLKSDYYYNVAKYDSALYYASLMEPVIIDSFGKNSLDYAWFVGQYYSMNYEKMNNIDSAAFWYKYSLQLFQKLKDTTSYMYGETLTNYGNLININLSFIEALPYLQKAVKVLEQHKDDADAYIGSISNLANYYNNCGEYSNAVILYKKCLALLDENPILRSGRQFFVFSNLASIYFKTGYFNLAKNYLIKAKDSSAHKLEDKYVNLACSNNLSALYLAINRPEKAYLVLNNLLKDPVFKNKALNNQQNIFATVYPETIRILGDVKAKQKHFFEAEKLYKQAIAITENLNLPSIRKFAGIFSLAFLYTNMARYRQADSLYEILLAKFDNSADKEHYFYTTMYLRYCENLIMMGQTQNATIKVKYIAQTLLDDFHNNFPGMTEDEQMQYLHSLKNYINVVFSIFVGRVSQNSGSVKLALNQLLQLKGMVLNYQARKLQSLRSSSDTVLNALNNQWLFLKQLLYKKYSGINSLAINIDSINKVIENLDEQISLRTGVAPDRLNNALADKISNKLTQEEAALEFIHYKEIKSKKDIYGVFIIRHNKEPEYFSLCTEVQLKDCFNEKKVFDVRKQLLKSEMIYNVLWKPIADLVYDKKTIYYSPDALLDYISFDGIKIKGGNAYLLNKTQLVQLTSTRNLLNTNYSDNNNKMDTAVLWGQIDCSEKAYLNNNNPLYKNKTLYYDQGLPDGLKGGKQGFSIWEDEEIPAIIKIAKRSNVFSKVYTKQNATEENFKLDAAQFNGILHISSHGFYSNLSPEIKSSAISINPFVSQVNPLLRCGLVLNGGNYVWSGKKPLPSREDGILTGYEISLMDLSKVNLIVLSACETGLGDIDPGSEGVLGLQRAFKLAGVQKMVLTLWEVSVKDTQVFMVYFYNELLNGQKPSIALRNAKLKMAKQYPPFAWAGFVLIE